MTIRPAWLVRQAPVIKYWKSRQDKNTLQCSTGKINGSFTQFQKVAKKLFFFMLEKKFNNLYHSPL
jgi:hypothetical protein